MAREYSPECGDLREYGIWGVLSSQMKKGRGVVYRARNDKSKNAKEEFIGDKGSSNGWKKLREVATQQRNEVRLRGA